MNRDKFCAAVATLLQNNADVNYGGLVVAAAPGCYEIREPAGMGNYHVIRVYDRYFWTSEQVAQEFCKLTGVYR